MPRVRFSPNFERHTPCPEATTDGGTVRAVLDAYFAVHERTRGYVLDEQGAVREHVAVFVGGAPIRDRTALTDPVEPDDVVDVWQALSGG